MSESSPLDGAGREQGPHSPIQDQVEYWETHQRFPQFVLGGLVDTSRYWRAQTSIHEGPAMWEAEAEFLYEACDFIDSEVPVANWLELSVETRLRLIRPWREQFAWLGADGSALATQKFLSLCSSFFWEVKRRGWVGTVVWLASGDLQEKESRRCPWCMKMLNVVAPDASTRLAVMRQAMESESAHLRRDAMRFLPPLVNRDDEFCRWVQGYAEEKDLVVRFWAAYHLAAELFRQSNPWVLEALHGGLTRRVSWDYDRESEQDSEHAISALSGLGDFYLWTAVEFLEEHYDDPPNPRDNDPVFAWHGLLTLLAASDLDRVKKMQDRWRKSLPPEVMDALERTKKLRELFRGINEMAKEVLVHLSPVDEATTWAIQTPLYVRVGDETWNLEEHGLPTLFLVTSVFDRHVFQRPLYSKLGPKLEGLMSYLRDQTTDPAYGERIRQGETLLAKAADLVVDYAGYIQANTSLNGYLSTVVPFACAEDILERYS